jgi:hypothetical protein
MAWNKGFLIKTTGIIFAGEAVASIGAILVAPLLDSFLDKKDNPVRKQVTRWIKPHVKDIERSPFHRGLHAMGEEVAMEEGAKEKEGKKLSYHDLPEEKRAGRIADILIKGGSLFVVDTVMSIAAQAVLNKLFLKERNFHPLSNGIVGAAVHLGCIIGSGTIFEKPTEWIYHKLTKILQKVTGMPEDKATRWASNATFIAGPGFVAVLMETLWNSRSGRGK